MSDETVTDAADDLEACRRALDELVSAIVRHDLEPAGRKSPKAFKLYSFGEITVERMGFRTLIDNPVREALRAHIKRVGQQVYRLGGMDALHDVVDRVASLDAMNEGRRSSALDAALNGVGEGDDRWWS